MCVASMVACACESALLELLEDDRILRNKQAIWQTLQGEVVYVVSISDYTWRRMANLVGEGCSAAALRSAALRVSCASVGYVYQELFMQLDEYPLRPTQGDIAQQLDELAALEKVPSEQATAKLKQLLNLGFPWQRIIDALTLARDAPCTTNLSEQLHGSGSEMGRPELPCPRPAGKANLCT